ncbi:hypothetical protein RB195_015054 [Necator americanus]|uniref:G-protein coupled receptors family 1 profile domain-containing protein n=1 Tax=Necator americanus TaxID=51031 RepID=A0ABR1E422_NECAM
MTPTETCRRNASHMMLQKTFSYQHRTLETGGISVLVKAVFNNERRLFRTSGGPRLQTQSLASFKINDGYLNVNGTYLWFLTIIIILFNCLGLFGNINVVVAVIRAPTLRTKAGFLMATLSLLQSICLLCELANLRIYWGRTVIEQSVCFNFVSVYLFATVAQSLMYFAIVMDMLIAVVFPVKHRMWSTLMYVVSMCIPPVTIAAIALIISYHRMHGVKLRACRPFTVAHEIVTAITVLLTATNTAAVVVVFILLCVVFRKEASLKGSRHRKSIQYLAPSVTNKTVRIISSMVAVFTCTWYFYVASTLVALNLNLPEEHLDYAMTLNLIPALVAYSQNFYALHACPRYSPVLSQQKAWLRCSPENSRISPQLLGIIGGVSAPIIKPIPTSGVDAPTRRREARLTPT